MYQKPSPKLLQLPSFLLAVRLISFSLSHRVCLVYSIGLFTPRGGQSHATNIPSTRCVGMAIYSALVVDTPIIDRDVGLTSAFKADGTESHSTWGRRTEERPFVLKIKCLVTRTAHILSKKLKSNRKQKNLNFHRCSRNEGFWEMQRGNRVGVEIPREAKQVDNIYPKKGTLRR